MPAVSGHPAARVPTAALEALRIVTGLGIFLVAGYLFRTVPSIPIMAIAVFGATLAAMLALIAFWNIGPVGSLAVLLLPLRGDRAAGGFSNANYLGFFAAQGALLAIDCRPATRGRYRPLLAVAVASLLAAMIVSFSRSAYIGTIAGLLVRTFLRSPRAALIATIVAVVAAVVLYPTFLEARLAGTDFLDPATIAERAQSENWRSLAAAAGITMFLTQPIFGLGYGVFQQVSPAFVGASPATYSHNAYIQILAEQGLVGAVMVAGILVSLRVDPHPVEPPAPECGAGDGQRLPGPVLLHQLDDVDRDLGAARA